MAEPYRIVQNEQMTVDRRDIGMAGLQRLAVHRSAHRQRRMRVENPGQEIPPLRANVDHDGQRGREVARQVAAQALHGVDGAQRPSDGDDVAPAHGFSEFRTPPRRFGSGGSSRKALEWMRQAGSARFLLGTSV